MTDVPRGPYGEPPNITRKLEWYQSELLNLVRHHGPEVVAWSDIQPLRPNQTCWIWRATGKRITQDEAREFAGRKAAPGRPRRNATEKP